MSYENAPATKMLATHCAICNRPLLDAMSVEIGMGPECRKKNGYKSANVTEEGRVEGNRIIHSIACGLPGEHFIGALKRLRDLGFDELVGALTLAKVEVQIEDHGDFLHVVTPYKEEALSAWRTIPGRKYDRETKCNKVPNYGASRAALWVLLRRFYGASIMQSSHGLTVVPMAQPIA